MFTFYFLSSVDAGGLHDMPDCTIREATVQSSKQSKWKGRCCRFGEELFPQSTKQYDLELSGMSTE